MKRVLFVLLLFLLSCSAKEAEQAIKLGYIGPMTGGAAQYGLPGYRLEQLAIDQINMQGGILGKKVEFIVEDDACDAKKAVNAFYKLVEFDKVNAVIGGHCSSSTLALAPLANEKKEVLLAVMTSTNDLSKFKDDYVFRMTPPSKYWSSGLADVLIGQGLREVALFYFLQDYPKGAADSFKQAFESKGGKILLEESFDQEDKDFRTSLLKVQELQKQHPELMVYIAAQSSDQGYLFLKQMKELGIRPHKLLGENAALSPQNFQSTDGFIKGAMYGFPYIDEKQNVFFSKALQKYHEKYGEELNWMLNHFANAYDAPFVLKQAFEACGSAEPSCVQAQLKSLMYSGASGSFHFDENGDPADFQIGVAVLGEKGMPVWLTNDQSQVLLFSLE
ncbi:MAG TPA: ABC transporter substrate-binding protein [Candidatus Nanoarchaeia archaeon]|nr:ABC transporter substrate-binding protein [Candidatus Nanoarchaeia archaeon]